MLVLKSMLLLRWAWNWRLASEPPTTCGGFWAAATLTVRRNWLSWFGKRSGWTYYVNGEMPDVGCSKCELHDGDKIRWVYVVDYTKSDVEMNGAPEKETDAGSE